MMFTHFGISGQLVLSASAKIGKFTGTGDAESISESEACIITEEQLDDRILREFSSAQRINSSGT